MLLSVPITAIGSFLGLRQMPLPTSSGAFMCEIANGPFLCAGKTWISHAGLGTRWSPVVQGIEAAIRNAGGERALARMLIEGTAAALSDENNVLVGGLKENIIAVWMVEEPVRPQTGSDWRHLEASTRRAGSIVTE